ncbi:MAG: hypothetical protein AB7T49_08960 [Oligoflexales bacterium]
MQDTDATNKNKVKIPLGTAHLKMAGDLLLGQIKDKALHPFFKKYQLLLEHLANTQPEERLTVYHYFLALILTSHARRSEDLEEKRRLFDLKNELFFHIVNNINLRKKLGLKYLVTKNFRVTEFCATCQENNKTQNLQRHQWKFCQNCKIDRKFFNVLCMTYKFNEGLAHLFLSNDLIDKVKNLPNVKRDKLENFTETLTWKKYKYPSKSLYIFDLTDAQAIHPKLLAKPF